MLILEASLSLLNVGSRSYTPFCVYIMYDWNDMGLVSAMGAARAHISFVFLACCAMLVIVALLIF